MKFETQGVKEKTRTYTKLKSAENESNLILTLALFIILLIFPFFLPEMKSRCWLASSIWKRISWWKF